MQLFNKKNLVLIIILTILLSCNVKVFAGEAIRQNYKYPDYAFEYLGNDKFENFNRKIFNFNTKLNKFVVKPVHILWASIMPQYGMERIKCACANIEFPIRVTSCLLQKDFKGCRQELMRFLTNSTLGIGGLYDPANKIFKMQPTNEDMEQALAKLHIKSGPYMVVPFLASTTPRNLLGKALDAGLNPSSYIGTPLIAAVKAGLTLNKTAEMQTIAKLLDSNFADPYDIARKLYGFNNYIKCENLDREDVLSKVENPYREEFVQTNPENIVQTQTNQNKPVEETALKLNDIIKAGNNADNVILKSYDDKNSKLMADIMLYDYNPQSPVTDAMRTALFDLPGINDSIWNELSIWNRCFSKQIKTAYVNIEPTAQDYKFRYIMQKDKSSPVAIIYPSIGEGVMSHHSIVLAKLFYEEGYSVIIQGNHFQWEFVKSMPKGYVPGIPASDVEYLRLTTSKIIDKLQNKYNCKFQNKVLIGTSFGAMATLFLADKESKNNTLNINKFIAINPPIELIYAMKQVDKNNEEWDKNPDKLKERVGYTAAKILNIYNKNSQKNKDFKLDTLPFTDEEAKIITSFVMHQKLADLVFTIENSPKCKKCGIYNTLNNMSYEDYVHKYILSQNNTKTPDKLDYETSLYSIENYLKTASNYKIYHSLDDYLVNHDQLKTLKQYSKNKAVLMSNGSHLGFLYRPEFINELRKDISLQTVKTANNN